MMALEVGKVDFIMESQGVMNVCVLYFVHIQHVDVEIFHRIPSDNFDLLVAL